MNNIRLWIATAIIAAIIIIGFILSVPHTSDIPEAKLPVIEATSTPMVTINDAFKKGVHTISGSIETPNACSTASVVATLQGDESTTESILLEISLSSYDGVCLQLPTRATFQTTISAPSNLPFTVTVNGSPAVIAPSS